MVFFGRIKELDALKNMYLDKGLTGAIIYGRRRFGKSTLIKESSKYFDGLFIYFQCLKALDIVNAQGLSMVIKDKIPDAFLSQNASFTEVLDFLFLKSLSLPILLVLDEYSYLNNREYIDSFLQSRIDQYKDTSKMKIILSGSYVDIMNHLLDMNNPLHGRFKYKIKLEAFNYYEASNFYKNVSLEDKVKYYAVFGGVPYYLSMLDTNKSFEDNVKYLLLSEFAPLENEINTTMKEEYSKVENAAFVMDLITRGKHSYSDIKAVFNINAPKSDLAYLLNQLVDMHFITKTYALNEKNEKKAYYDIDDNLFAFYFKLIYPTLAYKAILTTDKYFEQIKEKMYSEFIPLKFEKLCKEFLIRKNKNDEFNPPLLLIGSYTYNNPKLHKNGQFDIVTYDELGYTFYECKYTNSLVDKSIYLEEINQLNDAKITNYRLGFFSKSGFSNDNEFTNCNLFILEDLYK